MFLSIDVRLGGSDLKSVFECFSTKYTTRKDVNVMAQPDKKANHSIDGFGFRKMRSRGLVHMDSVHEEYSFDDQSGWSGSKAGDIASVRKVDPLIHSPVKFLPISQEYSNMFSCRKKEKNSSARVTDLANVRKTLGTAAVRRKNATRLSEKAVTFPSPF